MAQSRREHFYHELPSNEELDKRLALAKIQALSASAAQSRAQTQETINNSYGARAAALGKKAPGVG